MDLYTLLVFLNTPTQNAIRLVFNNKPRADNAYTLLKTAKANHIRGADSTTTVEATDDYGRAFTVDIAHVAGIQLSHVNSELNGEADLGMLQQHAQANFQKRLQTDPMLNRPGIMPVSGGSGPIPFPPRGN